MPDKRFTFDIKRELTSFNHLIKDNTDLGQSFKYNNFYEAIKSGNESLGDVEIEKKVSELMKKNYSLHYHVWDSNSYFRFISDLNCYLAYPFEVKHLQSNGDEIISIIEK